MYAVVVRVKVGGGDATVSELRDQVVPRVKSSPGFKAGYWTRSEEGSDGLSIVVFDSEENARAAAERIPQGMPRDVTLEDVQVREVVASA
jgi:heme-degrading monooxygenase HmoA